MKLFRCLILLSLFFVICSTAFGFTTEKKVYKKVNNKALEITFYYPGNFVAHKKNAAIIYFNGGGWIFGSII